MKPEAVPLRGVCTADELAARVVHTRLREVRGLSSGLLRRDQRGLHDFRIACKRLRYALERFEEVDAAFAAMTPCLARLQDALGEAHDRDVLLAILPPTMARTRQALHEAREKQVERAALLWKELRALAALTGFE